MAKITIGTTLILSPLTVIAKEKEFFREQGLDVDFRRLLTGRKAMQAIEKGWIDMGNIIDVNVAVHATQPKTKIKLLTCTQMRTDGSILARKDRGIETAQDLLGKKLGYMKETSSHMFLIYFCRHHGLNIEDLNLVPTRTDHMEKELLSGELDACSIWQPFTTRARIAAAVAKTELVVMKNIDFFELYVMMAVNARSLQKKRKEVEGALAALQKADEFIKDHTEEADQIVADSMDMQLSFYRQVKEDIHDAIYPIKPEFWTQVNQHIQWFGYEGEINYENFLDKISNVE